jgi:hypothetical protein
MVGNARSLCKDCGGAAVLLASSGLDGGDLDVLSPDVIGSNMKKRGQS